MKTEGAARLRIRSLLLEQLEARDLLTASPFFSDLSEGGQISAPSVEEFQLMTALEQGFHQIPQNIDVEFLSGLSLSNLSLSNIDESCTDASFLSTPAESRDADGAGDSFGQARYVGELEGVRKFQDRVGWSDRRDYYRFDLTRDADVNISLKGLSDDIDLYLYNDRGELIDYSYHGGRRDEAIQADLKAGTYYVLVAPYRYAISDYQLTLDAALDPVKNQDGAGNTFEQARDIGTLTGSKSFEDRVDASDQADYYRFQVDQSSNVTIQLDRLQADADIYLYDADGRLLARSIRGGNRPETISEKIGAGTYYVLVNPWSTAETSYQISFEAQAVETPPPTNPPPTNPPPTNPPPTNPPPTNPPPTNPPPTNPPPTNPPSNETEPLPDVAYYGNSRDWNVNHVNAPEAWARGYTGQGVVVAVIDTGVNREHHDLSSNIWRNTGEIAGDGIDNDGNGFVDDVYGWNFSENNNNTNDGNGHGTHVAGTIASARNAQGATGVAYGSRIMPVRVLGSDGSGSAYSVAAGIRYAVDNGAHVINLSLGGSYSQQIRNALVYARDQGVFVAIASGNSSASEPAYPARHSAGLDNTLSVGAHDQNDRLAYFSNRVGGSGAKQVDAPGVNIYSTKPGNQYQNLSGTSMATPHVAGLAALALSANPNLAPAQLRDLIMRGANRSIVGSNSSGGINAAMTVAMALVTSTTSQQSTQTMASTPSVTAASHALALATQGEAVPTMFAFATPRFATPDSRAAFGSMDRSVSHTISTNLSQSASSISLVDTPSQSLGMTENGRLEVRVTEPNLASSLAVTTLQATAQQTVRSFKTSISRSALVSVAAEPEVEASVFGDDLFLESLEWLMHSVSA